jgi:hypothetical protein
MATSQTWDQGRALFFFQVFDAHLNAEAELPPEFAL